MKDSIIEALKAENLKLKSRVDSLEEKIIELDISRNKLDQYTKRNNIEIHGILATVSDDHLEDKVLDICKAVREVILRDVTELVKAIQEPQFYGL